MTNRRLGSLLLFLLAVTLFVSGIIYLFAMRFESGDDYPPYSSYRSDPLGTRAFYEGIGSLPGVKASRNTALLRKQADMSGAVLFLIGLRKEGFRTTDPSWIEAVEKASREGGRVVIAFAPEKGLQDEAPRPAKSGEENGGKAEDEQKKPKAAESGASTLRDGASRPGPWRIRLGRLPRQQGTARLAVTGAGLPPSLGWHSALVFEPEGKDWRTIYAREGKPVILERALGKGEIVFLSDSFSLTNEAMKEDRSAALLSWLCGRHDRIVFDETHLGIADNPGVSTLLRKEGLLPFFLSLVVLVLLAIWRQAAPFVPPPPDGSTRPVETGRTHREGMRNLLRRNIPAGDVLGVCFEEWERSFAHGRDRLAPLTPRIRDIVTEDRNRPKRTRSPLDAYRRVSTLVVAHRRGEKK